MEKPLTVIITSNKGGSGKTPISINVATWALSKKTPWKVLVVDINHTNQDFFQAMQHLELGEESKFETAFSLVKTGTAYYLPHSSNLHLVRPSSFQPLSPPQTIEMITQAAAEYGRQKGTAPFEPDLIVVDGNYCFPSYRLPDGIKTDYSPFMFFNVWSITSPHELRTPSEYRLTIGTYKDMFDQQYWDKTNFVNIFSVLEKERRLSAEMSRLLHFQRGMYSIPGSDDLADLYKKIATNPVSKVEGYSFDLLQREIFSPILAEIDSLMVENPDSYSEDIINARWVERVNIFLTQHRTFPLNVLPLPHYYPFLRKAVVDMILRDGIQLSVVREIFGHFYQWMKMYLDRYMSERRFI
ncbi:MAG: ParA family protein [Candidatus Thorarchaeota archaeon]|nr:ParA family protein [Candidatus Thorarchaeota archaeon]